MDLKQHKEQLHHLVKAGREMKRMEDVESFKSLVLGAVLLIGFAAVLAVLLSIFFCRR